MARPKKKVKTPDEQVQSAIASIVVDSEYRTSASIQNAENSIFESLIDILECERNEKDYDWMSDSVLPEFNSIHLTDASQWANQYFQSRDFVEVKLDGDQDGDFEKARAAKKCVNKTLNIRDIFYYPKYMRLRTINSLRGQCYALCWWEQELRKVKISEPRRRYVTDETGAAVFENGQPKIVEEMVDREIEKPVIDRFNFDALDPRNVFTDNKYCYTAQQKDWIIIRSETTYDELKAKEQTNNYINLDKVLEAIKEKTHVEQTDTARETYGKESSGNVDKTPVHYFDILDRYGKFWAIVQEEENGNPIKVAPGIDEEGIPRSDAKLIEMILTFVVIGSNKILIRFEPTPFIDSAGRPYKPIARGWCYIHPTKDEGLSDGKNARELQIAINDTWNMGQDRVKLATLPTFKGRKYSLEDNSTVYMEPEHVIELENTDDLQELVVRDNIEGALNSLGLLKGALQQVTATYPTTMGAMPDMASTTATAVAGSEMRTNARSNYKSLTFEYTFLTEFYWLILQMTSRFAHDDTIIKMLGQDAQFFDANESYTYTPVTSNIETEYNKNKKIQMYDQTLGRISGMAQAFPEIMPVISHILGRQLELQGDEFNKIAGMLEKVAKAKPQGDGQTPPQMPEPQVDMTSNQNGTPMSMMEQSARQAMGMGIMG